MEIDKRLLPPWIGSEKYMTMLFSLLNKDSGPSIVYLYGARNVGKTTTLEYLLDIASKKGIDVVMLKPLESMEDVYVRDVFKAIDKHELVILDEISHVEEFKDNPERIVRFLESLAQKLSGTKKKFLFTASYSIVHRDVIDELVRVYGKRRVKPPVSVTNRNQPWRIFALPRPFTQLFFYLYDIESKALTKKYRTYPLLRKAVPEAALEEMKYGSISEDRVLRRILLSNSDKLIEAFRIYLITGGFPELMKIAKETDVLKNRKALEDPLRYISEELDRVLNKIKRRDEFLKVINSLIGPDHTIKVEDNRLEVFKTYILSPLRKLNEVPLSVSESSYRDLIGSSVVPIALDPGALTTLVYKYLPHIRERQDMIELTLPGRIESAVYITLFYLLGYTNPNRWVEDPPPLYRPSNADFLTYMSVDVHERSSRRVKIPIIVEAKSKISSDDLKEGSKLFNETVKPLALLGYRRAVYPFLVFAESPDIYDMATINVEIEADERDKELHAEARTQYYLGSSPYKKADTWKVVVVPGWMFAMSPPLAPAAVY